MKLPIAKEQAFYTREQAEADATRESYERSTVLYVVTGRRSTRETDHGTVTTPLRVVTADIQVGDCVEHIAYPADAYEQGEDYAEPPMNQCLLCRGWFDEIDLEENDGYCGASCREIDERAEEARRS